jgi:RNA polymerase sigma-70 factor (ECF subfamily)
VKPSTAPRRDHEEFEGRLEAHRGIVFKLANAYCPAGEERDDLVQEICLQLWRSYPGYDRERRFSTWMFRVALNTAISFARAARTREMRAVPLDTSAAAALATAPQPEGADGPDRPDERLRALHLFLHRLDELDRALVLLHLEDRSYRDIAEILGISETNVGTRLNRCRQKMRQQLTPEGKEIVNGTR